MAILLPGAMNQLAGVLVTAQFERLRSSHLTRSFPSTATNGATRLDGQGGVWPQVNALNVTASSTPDMNVHVDRGGGLTQGTQNTAQGNYPFFNLASLAVGISAANTTARIDSIVAHVKDTFYSGVTDTSEFVSVPGTPGSGSPPNLSSLDNNYLEVARVAVGANVTSINNANITNLQHILPVGLDIPNSSEFSNPGSFVGHPRVNTSTGEFEWWDSSAWRGQKWVAYTPTWAGFSATGTGPSAGGRYFKTGTRVKVEAWWKAGTGVSLGTGHITITLPFTSANPSTNDQWYGQGSVRAAPGSTITQLTTTISPAASSGEILAANTSNQLVTPGNGGLSLAVNNLLQANFDYESSS